jgi:transcriptional regulator of acetoin/glycerol metabolism
MRRTEEANHLLAQAARPVLKKLGAAIADTRYFAILTNAQGVVVDVSGPIDRQDRRADLITRIGVDLSEASVGTTAIGAALTELQPVWLHRGEHFFNATSAYSCAGAPLFGPDGRCAGMLDLTGGDAVERPELRHLVVQSARSIENALTQSKPHDLLVRLN